MDRPETRAVPRLDLDEDEGWSLWWPCAECGGARVSLLADPNASRVDEVLAVAEEHIASGPCPGCVTREQRSSQGGTTPAAWYDTTLRDWVVRIHGADGQELLLPLEIRWYDAPLALVETAAAKAAFAAPDATRPLTAQERGAASSINQPGPGTAAPGTSERSAR